MSALAIAPPDMGPRRPGADRGRGRGPSDEPAPTLFDEIGAGEMGGEPTLDELVSGAWEGLAAHRAVACPVCGGEMTPEYGAHARPIGGRCAGCGTDLS